MNRVIDMNENENSEEKIFLPEYKADVNYIISNASDSENDVVAMDFPEYSEDFPRIIGEEAYEKEESFVSHKADIYNRNMLKADEDDFIHKERVREEQERLEEEVRQLEDDIKFADFMKKFRTVMLIAAAAAVFIFVIAVVNFTSEDEEEISETVAAMTEIFTTVTSETASEKSSAPVSETEITTQKVIPPEKMPLVPEEGQHYYEDKRISAVIEFTGAESVRCYPKDIYGGTNMVNRDYAYVFFADLSVKNISNKSFDFIPQDMWLRDEHNQAFYPVDYEKTNLTTFNGMTTVDPGEVYTVSMNFVGRFDGSGDSGTMIKEIMYYPHETREYTDDEGMLRKPVNASAAEDLHFINEDMSSLLPEDIQTWLDKQLNGTAITEKVNQPLAPQAGEYSVTTDTMSYCFKITPIDDGNYVQVDLRMQNLTDYARLFYHRDFRLVFADGSDIISRDVSCDKSYLKDVETRNAIKGAVGVTEIYEMPFQYFTMDTDGYGEYTLFFFTGNDSIADITSISFDCSESYGQDKFIQPVSIG